MSPPVKIQRVKPLEDHWLRLWFGDGAVIDVDLGDVLNGGVLKEIHDDRGLFERVRVNEETGTIEWPNGIDMDKEMLYGLGDPVGMKIERREVVPAAD
jgi:hypothetical protein